MNNSVLEKLLPCEGFMCADGYIVIELVRWLSLDTVVSDHLLWPVSPVHLGHGRFSDFPSTIIQMQANKSFSSHGLLAFLLLRWEQKVAPLAHLQILSARQNQYSQESLCIGDYMSCAFRQVMQYSQRLPVQLAAAGGFSPWDLKAWKGVFVIAEGSLI